MHNVAIVDSNITQDIRRGDSTLFPVDNDDGSRTLKRSPYYCDVRERKWFSRCREPETPTSAVESYIHANWTFKNDNLNDSSLLQIGQGHHTFAAFIQLPCKGTGRCEWRQGSSMLSEGFALPSEVWTVMTDVEPGLINAKKNAANVSTDAINVS